MAKNILPGFISQNPINFGFQSHFALGMNYNVKPSVSMCWERADCRRCLECDSCPVGPSGALCRNNCRKCDTTGCTPHTSLCHRDSFGRLVKSYTYSNCCTYDIPC